MRHLIKCFFKRFHNKVAFNDEIAWSTAFWFWKNRVAGVKGVSNFLLESKRKYLSNKSEFKKE